MCVLWGGQGREREEREREDAKTRSLPVASSLSLPCSHQTKYAHQIWSFLQKRSNMYAHQSMHEKTLGEDSKLACILGVRMLSFYQPLTLCSSHARVRCFSFTPSPLHTHMGVTGGQTFPVWLQGEFHNRNHCRLHS